MATRKVIPRLLAVQDLEEAVSFYAREGGEGVALGFVAAAARTFAAIGRRPSAGSPRYAHELGLPGLRCWPVARHPYVVFFVEGSDHVDVWRVLHGQRDIPASLIPTRPVPGTGPV